MSCGHAPLRDRLVCIRGLKNALSSTRAIKILSMAVNGSVVSILFLKLFGVRISEKLGLFWRCVIARILPKCFKRRSRSETALTFCPVRSSLEQGSRHQSFWVKFRECGMAVCRSQRVSQAMKANYCVLRHIGGTLCGLSV